MKRAPKPPRSPKPEGQRGEKRKGSLAGLIILVLILGLVSAILIFKEPLRTVVMSDGARATLAPSSPGSRSGSHAPAASPAPNSGNATSNRIVVEGGSSVTTPLATTVPANLANQTVNPTKPPEDNPQDPLKQVQLYWVRVSDDGVIHLEKIQRALHLGDSPMSAAIRSLIRGPSADELNHGLLSLVPKGTQLLSAYVQNRTAFLNFSDEFQYNPMGNEGFKSQLRQVVYTATEFNTVDSVQILINGKRIQYLGGDGLAVGKPLSRSAF